MKTSDFDYDLPEELIAQTPVEPRDHSRLLVYHRGNGQIEHKHFYDIIDYLNPGDALVINETKVIPARLLGVKEGTGLCKCGILHGSIVAEFELNRGDARDLDAILAICVCH